jgi:hypothetical protein
VIELRPMEKLHNLKSGTASLEETVPPPELDFWARVRRGIARRWRLLRVG